MTVDTFLHQKGNSVDNFKKPQQFKNCTMKFYKTEMRNFSFVYYLIQICTIREK